MSGFLVFILAIVSLGAGLVGWFATPKGMNQTSVDLPARSSSQLLYFQDPMLTAD